MLGPRLGCIVYLQVPCSRILIPFTDFLVLSSRTSDCASSVVTLFIYGYVHSQKSTGKLRGRVPISAVMSPYTGSNGTVSNFSAVRGCITLHCCTALDEVSCSTGRHGDVVCSST